MSTETDGGWDLVATALTTEIEQRGLTLRGISEASGVSYPTLRKLIDGQPVARRDRLVALARALDWPADAFDRIRAGRPPVLPEMSASGVDLDELARVDPEMYVQIEQMARLALDRANKRREP